MSSYSDLRLGEACEALDRIASAFERIATVMERVYEKEFGEDE